MATKYLQEEIVEKFIKKHGTKYDYSKVSYSGIFNKIVIICKMHGEFEQIAKNHLEGKGCAKCVGRVMNTEYFKEIAIKVHKNNYDYTKSIFENSKKKIIITCQKHGDFLQTPDIHLRGSGCFKCNGSPKHTYESIINKFKHTHGNKYDYSLVKYNGIGKNITIICRKHGQFIQKSSHHLSGAGCPKCCESRGENIIRAWLVNNKLSFDSQKKFIDCKYKKQLPFDFYLPTFKVCIEFDGIQHHKAYKRFGGEDGLVLRKHKDALKDKYCIDNDIKLLRIQYAEINNIHNILSSFLF